MGRIGIMGGTFDPIHKGHLLLGRQALKEYRLDQVWYMPSGQPPHKRDHDITDVKDRLAMVELAVRHDPDFLLSDFETSREGNTYTAQTLRLLKEAYPQHEFFFIIGADSLYEIEYWYHPEKIIGVVPILVADREYSREHREIDEQILYLKEKYQGEILKLHCREVDVASKEIRQLVRDGHSVENYLPEEVEKYIISHHLYQEA